jgi:hypothetical protein
LIAACSAGDQQVDLGQVANVAGLVGASVPPGNAVPEIVSGSSPKLSPTLIEALETSEGEIQAVVRILIGPDDVPFGVDVLEVEPADSLAASQYGESVAQVVWDWSYVSARRNHVAIQTYLDLRFRYPRTGTD